MNFRRLNCVRIAYELCKHIELIVSLHAPARLWRFFAGSICRHPRRAGTPVSNRKNKFPSGKPEGFLAWDQGEGRLEAVGTALSHPTAF